MGVCVYIFRICKLFIISSYSFSAWLLYFDAVGDSIRPKKTCNIFSY